jgi:hypothetical protein
MLYPLENEPINSARVSFLPKSKEKSLMRLSINNLTPTIENTMTNITYNGTETSPITSDSGFDSVQKWDCAIALQIPILLLAFSSSITQLLKAVKLMSKLFRGCRVWIEFGTWINNKGHLVWDLNVWVQSSMTRHDFELHSHQVKEFLEQMRQNLRQEAVVLEVNNKEIFLLF